MFIKQTFYMIKSLSHDHTYPFNPFKWFSHLAGVTGCISIVHEIVFLRSQEGSLLLPPLLHLFQNIMSYNVRVVCGCLPVIKHVKNIIDVGFNVDSSINLELWNHCNYLNESNRQQQHTVSSTIPAPRANVKKFKLIVKVLAKANFNHSGTNLEFTIFCHGSTCYS